MITPENAMNQAHMTADLYAYEGSKAFERIFGFWPENEPQAAAVFIGQYMRAAAHDYDVAMREQSK